MRIFLGILLIFLILRFLGNIRVYTMGSRSFRHQADDPSPGPTKAPQASKIIDKNEGEYVDYEEVKE